MMTPSYRVELTTSAYADVRALPPPVRQRLLSALTALEHEPRPYGCRQALGRPNALRFRIGDYRVVYDVYDRTRFVRVAMVGDATSESRA